MAPSTTHSQLSPGAEMLIAIVLASVLVCFGVIYQHLRTYGASTNSPPAPVVKHSVQNATESDINLDDQADLNTVKQPFDAFLVVDVEGTCEENTAFGEYPNEIIEWPVCLMRWTDKKNGHASRLEIVDIFRSFVRPSWRPQLSAFCTALTGITQRDIDTAPLWHDAMRDFETFLVKNGLYDSQHHRPLVKYTFCCDGPWDLSDFFVKQMHIARFGRPGWLHPEFINVRWHTEDWILRTRQPFKRLSMTIAGQLRLLGIGPFEGRQHCGIDDTRNVCRILATLAERGQKLVPNTTINFNRRWPWMGKRGQIREEYVTYAKHPFK